MEFQTSVSLTVSRVASFQGSHRIHVRNTLQGTNISPQNGILKMIFLFPRWDMLIPWRVSTYIWLMRMVNVGKCTNPMDPMGLLPAIFFSFGKETNRWGGDFGPCPHEDREKHAL